jgi:ketosteroid isomerase-like protein
MSIDLLNEQKTFVSRVAKGEFLEVMEDYYTDDVFQVEGNGTRREGKGAILAFEREFLTKVKAFNGVQVGSIGVASDDGGGNGVTFAEYSIDAELEDGVRFTPEQVQVTTWKGGKIAELRYYYDPSF